MTKNEKILWSALEEARAHLEFCGYGDVFERECAIDLKLPEQIEKALASVSKDKHKPKTIKRNTRGI